MKKIEVGDIIFSNIYNLCGAFEDYETDAQKITRELISKSFTLTFFVMPFVLPFF